VPAAPAAPLARLILDRHVPEIKKAAPASGAKPATARLKALLLRVGTMDRMALGEVLNIIATQTAADARVALETFDADLVVADISHSDVEALTLLRHLRSPATAPRNGLQMICLLAASSPERVRGLVKAGVDHVMIKPISAVALRNLAQNLSEHPMPQVAVPQYVGPDRRRLPIASYTGPARRTDE
jgi:DNA-binding NarL/FixJ family response regulator